MPLFDYIYQIWYPVFLLSSSNSRFQHYILDSKGAIASPCLKPLLTSNSEDKCLPILTLPYISLCKILHKLTSSFGKSSLCISLHISFLHSVLCCLKINSLCTSLFCSKQFSNICLMVKMWSAVYMPLWKPPWYCIISSA